MGPDHYYVKMNQTIKLNTLLCVCVSVYQGLGKETNGKEHEENLPAFNRNRKCPGSHMFMFLYLFTNTLKYLSTFKSEM